MTTDKEDAMRRTHRALITLALGLALVTATTAAAAAAPPTGTQDQADQGKALYQSEQERTQARHHALGVLGLAAERNALYRSERDTTLARHRALGALTAQPAARTGPAAPSPGVDVPATLLVVLVGGLLGGSGVVVGWIATTRRRRPRAVAGT
jgi:hypothetical protein